MRFEREGDIPAFKDKTWRERIALRRLAAERDRVIGWLRILCGIGMGLIFVATMTLMRWFDSHASLYVGDLVFAVSASIFAIAFYGFFITPRIHRALASDEDPSA
jgi:hypothetical protein